MEYKKIFHNRKFIIAVSILAVIVIIAIICMVIGNRNYEQIDWNSLVLGKYLPKPEKNYGEINYNSENLLEVVLPKITEQEYKEYTNKCITEGYNIDIKYEFGDTLFEAFNDNGYNILVSYTKNENSMKVRLDSPEEMDEFEWPTTGLGSMLPKPKSNYGKIGWNSSESLIIDVGNTTIEEYNEYVKECENFGYTIDYLKGEETYSAKNSDGYSLSVSYSGWNVINIYLKAPEEQKEQESTNNTLSTNNSENLTESEANVTENTTENNTETANPSIENTTVETNVDDYSNANYRDDAEDSFLAEIRSNCPYGVKIHTITGWLAKTYEGEGIWFFKVNITETNAFGSETDKVAEGRVDAKNGNNITYFKIY